MTDNSYKALLALQRGDPKFCLKPYDVQYPPIPARMLFETFEPRMEVVRHCLQAVGISFLVESGRIQWVDSPEQRSRFLERAVIRIEETQSSVALSQIFKGSPDHYFYLALKNLPTRVLALAERTLTDTKGQPLLPRDIASQRDGKKGGLLATFKKWYAGALVEDDSEGGMIEIPHDPFDVAKVALGYSFERLADVAAEQAVRTCIADSIIEAKAIAGLESKGLISDHGPGRSHGEVIVTALLYDFNHQYLDERSFSPLTVRDLRRLVGIEKLVSDETFADLLATRLNEMRAAEGQNGQVPVGSLKDGPK